MKQLNEILAVLLFVMSLSVVSNAQDVKDKNTSPLTIIYKPMPNYTDDARRESVEGTVKLKVTFLATGNIGEIAEIKEENKKELRETGLIGQAIRAAKKIRFKPAIQNGKHITVTKTVVFTFTIY